MSKKISVLFLFVCITATSYGNTDFTEIIQHKKFQINIASASGGITAGYKIRQLAYLLLKLQKEYFTDSDYVQINFGVYKEYKSDKIIFDRRPYCLSFDDCEFEVIKESGDWTGKKIIKKAIILNILTDSVSEKEILKLVLYGLKHRKEIQSMQHVALAKHFHDFYNLADPFANPFNAKNVDYKIVKTISEREIKNILSRDNSFVDPLLRFKFYRHWFPMMPETYGKANLYCQNDSIYVYEDSTSNISQLTELDYSKGSKTGSDTLNTALFGFSNISNMMSDRKNNYLVFMLNGSFYHIRLKERTISGPFKMVELEGRLSKYSTLTDSITTKGDNISIHLQPMYGNYDVIFDTRTGLTKIDSTSFSPDLKRAIEGEKSKSPESKQREEKYTTIEDFLYQR